MTNMRRLDVQGLRAVAILLVVGFHGDFGVHGGFTGVDVFFAVSGFVITSTLLRELVDGNRLDFLAFYARRIRRLLPALALMVAVVALVGLLATPIAAGRLAALTGVFASGFASNVYLALRPTGYFDLGTGLDPLLHTWTLGVEEQFYIIFPALLLLGWVIGRRFGGAARAGAFTVVAIACVVSGLLAIALEHGRIGGTRGQQYAFFLSPPRAWEFGAGALVALVVPTLTRLPAAVAWVLQALGLVGILAGGFLLTATSVSAPRLGLPVFGTCALIAAGTAVSGGVTRVLALRPFVWIGDLSYSWYLWHWPLIVFAVALWPGSGAAPRVAAIVSLLPAWLSYRYVENPIRYGFRRGIRPALGLAAVCVGVGVAASLVLLGGVHALDRTASVQSWQRSQEPHADEWRHCHADSVDAAEVRRCTWRVPHPRGLVALVGDSNAGQFAEAVLAADAQTHHDTLLLTAPCPYVDLVLHPLGPSADCLHAYRTTAAVLTRLHPALVIVASRSDQYVYQWGIGHPGQPLTRDTPRRLALWYSGLGSALRTLSRAGSATVVVHPVPILPVPTGACAEIRILTGTCATTVARSAVDAELGPVAAVESRAAASVPGASTLSVEDEICDTRCSSTRGGTLMYRNAAHLSVDGALRLTPLFERTIAARTRAADVSAAAGRSRPRAPRS